MMRHLVADSYSGKAYMPGREPVFENLWVDLPPRSSVVLIAKKATK